MVFTHVSLIYFTYEYDYSDIFATMFIATQFVIATSWKQFKCLSTEEQIKKM